MASTFSLILVVVCVITGIIWCLDKMIWSKQRAAKIAVARAHGGAHLDEKTLAKVAPIPVWIEQTAGVFPVITLVLILRSFLFEPFQIPSGSMMPTLLVGDFILVQKFAYGLKDPVTNTRFLETGDPKRGDVVVFKYPLDTPGGLHQACGRHAGGQGHLSQQGADDPAQVRGAGRENVPGLQEARCQV